MRRMRALVPLVLLLALPLASACQSDPPDDDLTANGNQEAGGRDPSASLDAEHRLVPRDFDANIHNHNKAASDTLPEFAAKCDAAIGVTVPDFVCDNGTLVPTTNHANGKCDRPNRLNKVCDPGSKFQVLADTADAYVVAHCRKQGNAAGFFGDIAVIQHNKRNGATCFYQALGTLNGNVKAPSKGPGAWPWLSPAQTEGIKCVRCHDNGPLIRSPYLSQVTGANRLPGAGDTSFNRDQPYSFVGADFASWKAYKVEVGGNTCNGCHRMGTNNAFSYSDGTGLDFGIRATATSEAAKNPHSATSPIWMLPGQVFYDATRAAAAQEIRNCALRRTENPLPSSSACRITEFASAYQPPGIVSPRAPGLAEVNAVSRSADKLDIFVTDVNGVIYTAAWQPSFTDWWHGWWQLNGGRAQAGAPVHAVSRSSDKLDAFVIGTDQRVYTAAWEPTFTDWWHGWWQLNGGVAAQGAHVTVVSRAANKLDAFVVGTDGYVYTATWEPSFTDWWHGWYRIGNIRVPQGAAIHGVSRSVDKIDIFATDVNGVIWTAAYDSAGWHGWWELIGGRARPGAPVTAVSRSPDKLDVFVVGTDGRVWTAAWQPSFTDWWHGWWPIGTTQFPQGAPIHAVSRSTDKLDIFGTDSNGYVVTAAWEPGFTDGWHGWWYLNGGRAAPGAPVTAVSRSTDKLDAFVIGLDGRVYTAAWEPTFTDWWHGWWPIGQ